MALKKLQVINTTPYCIISIKDYIYYSNYELIVQRDLKGNTKTFHGHTERILCFAVIDDYLYSSGYDGQIIKWNQDGSILSIIYSRESIYNIININNVLYSSNNKGHIQKYNEHNTKTILLNIEEQSIDCLTFNNDLYYFYTTDPCTMNIISVFYTSVKI